MTNISELDNHIVHIVQNFDIREQKDLQHHLKKRGHDVPQSTLSRHLKKLKIVKMEHKYVVVDYNQLQPLPRVTYMKVSSSDLIILHTHPGNANTLAYFLDQNYVSFSPKDSKFSPILGVIAGDDTVLIIAKNSGAKKEIISILQGHFPYLECDELLK